MGRCEPIFFSFMAMAFASKGPIQIGRPVLLARSIKRTTKPLDVESKVKNFTFISTYIELLLYRRNPAFKREGPLRSLLSSPKSSRFVTPLQRGQGSSERNEG